MIHRNAHNISILHSYLCELYEYSPNISRIFKPELFSSVDKSIYFISFNYFKNYSQSIHFFYWYDFFNFQLNKNKFQTNLVLLFNFHFKYINTYIFKSKSLIKKRTKTWSLVSHCLKLKFKIKQKLIPKIEFKFFFHFFFSFLNHAGERESKGRVLKI